MELVIQSVSLFMAVVIAVKADVLRVTVAFPRPAIPVFLRANLITVVVVTLPATDVKADRTVPLPAIHILNLVLRATFVLTGVVKAIALRDKVLVLLAIQVIPVPTVELLTNIVERVMVVLPVKVIARQDKGLVQGIVTGVTALVTILVILLHTLSVLMVTINAMELITVLRLVNHANIVTVQLHTGGLVQAVRVVLTVTGLVIRVVTDVILPATVLAMAVVIAVALLITELVKELVMSV